MLGHRLRRWPSINTTLVQRFLFAGAYLRLTLTMSVYYSMYDLAFDEAVAAPKMSNIPLDSQ